MAGTTGLEPATSAVTGQRSNQLSYVPGCVSGLALMCRGCNELRNFLSLAAMRHAVNLTVISHR